MARAVLAAQAGHALCAADLACKQLAFAVLQDARLRINRRVADAEYVHASGRAHPERAPVDVAALRLVLRLRVLSYKARVAADRMRVRDAADVVRRGLEERERSHGQQQRGHGSTLPSARVERQ